MAYCNNCGNKIDSIDKYCTKCGNALQVVARETDDLIKKGNDEPSSKNRLIADVNVTMTKKSVLKESVAPGLNSFWTKIKGRYFSQDWFRIWFISHCVIFILALTGSDIFNYASYKSSQNMLWPFSGFSRSDYRMETTEAARYSSLGTYVPEKKELKEFQVFSGLFYGYDLSELLLYLVIGFVVAHLNYKNKSSSNIKPNQH
jgi:hypothetical protein